MRFKLHKNDGHEQPFHSTILAKNGKILFTSETYHNFRDMVDTIISLVGKGEDSTVQCGFHITEEQFAYLQQHANINWDVIL